jgi:thioredoxin 1
MPTITLTDHNFQQHITDTSVVLVDFWAPWCPPCKMIDPVMHQLADEYQGKLTLGKINTDENPQLVEQLNVMSMPTVMLFKNGHPIKALVGAQSKQTYQQAIEEVLSN